MENRTLTKKTVAICFAAIFLLNKILSAISDVIAISRFDGFYENMTDYALASYYSSAFTSVGSFIVNIITIASIIIAGKKLTGSKTGTIRFLGCYYFGAAVGTLFSSLISNVFQYLMAFFIPASTGSTIIIVSGFLCLVPAILAASMAFTAFEGLNDRIPAHPLNVALSKARITFIITFIISAVVSGVVGSLPSYLRTFINPELGTFVSDALIFSGYLAKWLANVIVFAVVYIAGYRMAKSHYGAISFYIPASALSVPVTGIISGISSIIVSFLRYSNQLKIAEAAKDDQTLAMMANNSTAMSVIAIAGTVISAVIGFIISYKALSMFYTNKAEYAPVEQ
ncbi:MAG: hypothetical protein IKJ27_07450 [Clostridia bacterium]|nr:hypothetical protein [Clostridia bacterium]MBR3869293.1 hypothetical protein [Clostridia bacterium]